MPMLRKYNSNAERQAAYRARKAENPQYTVMLRFVLGDTMETSTATFPTFSRKILRYVSTELQEPTTLDIQIYDHNCDRIIYEAHRGPVCKIHDIKALRKCTGKPWIVGPWIP